MAKPPVVVFVDADAVPVPAADGITHDRHEDLLAALAHERIMIVFTTWRTRAQLEATRQAYGVFHPFISEGGAAAFVPDRYFGSDLDKARKVGGYQALEFAAAYEDTVETLRRVSERLHVGVLGFHDMSVELAARECGLSLLEARLAKLREYGEPFRLLVANPVAERRLIKALEAAGVCCTRRGHFHYATSIDGPGQAIAALTDRYRAAFGRVLTAGAFDGADLPLTPSDAVVPSTPREWLQELIDRIEVTRDHRVERASAPEHAATPFHRPADHRRFEPRTLRP